MRLSIKDLYFKIQEFRGEEIFETLIQKWVLENDYKKYISNLSLKIQIEKIELTQEDIWELYALSRVLDILTLQFQTNNRVDDSSWAGTQISLSEYVEFNNMIGLTTEIPSAFKPFDCEIIEAQAGQNDFQINETCFPASKLNNLIIKRAGVKVSLNKEKYDVGLVNLASIYWTFWRKNRKYSDLSQGWGSNSQWRTDLRLDIETDDSFIYNLQGEFDINNPTDKVLEQLHHDNLEVKEAIELTKFRHFMTCTKDDSDLFPYDYKYTESKCS